MIFSDMVKETLVIGRWVVDFLFCEREYDGEGVLGCLYDAYAPWDIMAQAEDLMLSCERNCGFTYSNGERRRAVVLIGPASSGDEWLDTLVHEIRHLADAIAKELGVRLDSERPAYLSGHVVRELAELVCLFGCSDEK